MQHDPLFQQDMVAHAHQLGALEAEYATDPRKILVNFGLILVFALLAPLLVLGTSHSTANVIPPIIFSFLFFSLVGGSILFGFYRAYRYLHVYVYTNGLFYSNGAFGLILLHGDGFPTF